MPLLSFHRVLNATWLAQPSQWTPGCDLLANSLLGSKQIREFCVFGCEWSCLRKRLLAAESRPVSIGSGSFGTAYAAKSAAGGPIVYKRFSVPREEFTQFEDELGCHKALRAKGGHPNVLLALKTFSDPAKRSYCVAAPLASMLLQDITRGLSFVHTCAIIHRDLKPCNIILFLLGHQGGRLRARISDFGCSRLQSVRPTETLNFCTCLHRAPEVFELVMPAWLGSTSPDSGEPDLSAIGNAIAVETSPRQNLMRRYSFAADVWSLGCVCAEFLHSRILFQSSGSADVSLLATIAARIGLPEKGILEIKGWPEDRILDLAKASHLASTCPQRESDELYSV